MAWDLAVVLLDEGARLNAREWIEAGQGLALLRRSGVAATGHLVRNERQRVELAEKLRRKAPRLTFLHVGGRQGAAGLAMLNALGPMLAPGAQLALGGTHATLCSHEFTSHRLVDGVLLGEWVETLADVARCLRGEGGAIEAVPGMWWRSPHGWKLTGRRTAGADLEQWPDPALEDFRVGDLCRHDGGSLPLLASRGFPFQSLASAEPMLRNIQASESYYYVRPPARVAGEAAALRKRHRVRHIEFADEVFPWREDWTAQFVRHWKRQVGLPFAIRGAAEHLPESRLRQLQEAGLERVEFEVEGGDEALRRRHSELNCDNRTLLDVIDRCHRLQVRTRIRLHLGMPGETRETLAAAAQFAEVADPTELEPIIHRPWPTSAAWHDLERSLSGIEVAHPAEREQPMLGRNLVVAWQDMVRGDSLRRAERRERSPDATLDGLSEFAAATVRSPLEAAARLTTFSSPTATNDVLALRVPSEISWEVSLPPDPVVHFGMLLEPALPGERARQPISFSVKIQQHKRTWRVFQKVVLQALDPDSRDWHFFKLPIPGASRGKATLLIENLVYGEDATAIPAERDLWAGWARLIVTSSTQQDALEDTDQELLQ